MPLPPPVQHPHKTMEILMHTMQSFYSPPIICTGETKTRKGMAQNLRITVNMLKKKKKSTGRIFQILLCYLKEHA